MSAPAIVTPLTYGDALELVSGAAGPDCSRARLAHLLMAVDTASRAQTWADRGGPELVQAANGLRWLENNLHQYGGPRWRELFEAACVDARAAIAKAEGRA